jgi:hypothetical protein
MTASATTVALIALDGPVLRDSFGAELARLGDDGRWRAPDGAVCEHIGIPAIAARAIVTDAAQVERNRELDGAWLAAQLPAVAALAMRLQELTSDDVWAALTMPPRESRLIGVLLNRAAAGGLIEATERHVPSRRGINNRRPVRVWRSLRFAQGELPIGGA